MDKTIMVVGVCASGKTTVIEALQARGYDARTCSQEHSLNRFLWQRGQTCFLVVLDCRCLMVEKRRNRKMPITQYQEQKNKLACAQAMANIYLLTDDLTVEDTVKRIIDAYEEAKEKNEGDNS